MNVRPDVLIVGAGIVGAACAYECSKRGLQVAVLDAAPPGGGATAACMGQVVVMDDSEAQFALTRLSQELWDQLAPELPPAAEHFVPGTLWLAADDDELSAANAKLMWYRARGVDAEVLDAKALHEAEPELNRDLVGALHVPGDSIVYPSAIVDWLLARARAEVRIGTPVRRVVPGQPPRCELTDGTVYEADTILVAAGIRALELLPEPLPGVAIRPRKGHLVITDRYPEFCHHQLVELGYLKSAHSHADFSVAFNLQPRATGQMLLGSSRQYGSEEREVEPRVVTAMIARALDYVPRITELQAIRAWTGFRAATEDSLPVIGEVAPGVMVAAGHEGLGITTSLGTGQLIADELEGVASPIPREPYSPLRTTAEAQP